MENERNEKTLMRCNERTLMRCDDIDIEEERVAKMGRLLTKANVLQAIVNVALSETRLDNYDDALYLKDDGKAVLLLISAFFEEEYDFRIAQLKAERDEKKKGDKA